MAASSAPGALLKKLTLGARRALPFVSAHVRSQFSRGSFAPRASHRKSRWISIETLSRAGRPREQCQE